MSGLKTLRAGQSPEKPVRTSRIRAGRPKNPASVQIVQDSSKEPLDDAKARAAVRNMELAGFKWDPNRKRWVHELFPEDDEAAA